MECPYCNQEHPNGTKFCPETGNKMPNPIVGCPNKECPNFQKKDIPTHYKYCPECGTPLKPQNTENVDKSSFDSQIVQSAVQKQENINYECENKDVADTCLFVAIDQKKNINVINANNRKNIYEGWHNKLDVRILSEDGHDVLYIKSGPFGSYTKITPDGNIENEVTWEQTSMCDINSLFNEEDFLKEFPKYIEVGSFGYLKNEKVHVLLVWYKESDKEIAEVITNKGQLLFNVGDPDKCLFFPVGMTPQGLIIVKNRDDRKGLWDLQGKEILPCIYESIESVNSKEPIFSEYLEIYDGDKVSYFNINTKEQVSEVTKYNKFQMHEEEGSDYIDVFDIATNKLILKHIRYNSGMTKELVDGWYMIHEWEEIGGYMRDLSYILVRGNKYFRLPCNNNEILEKVFSSGRSDMTYYIGQNRIITSMEKDNSDGVICLENMAYFAIRDHEGNIICKKSNPTIWPLHPYRHNKVLAFKMKDEEVSSLVYLDLQGKEHHIPNTSHYYFDNPYDIANKEKCGFVSEDTFILNCSDEEGGCYKLIDIKGNVLIDNAWDLEDLAGGYILYKKDWDKVGVVDSHGYEVLRPIYKGVTIIRGNTIIDKDQEIRLFH